MKISQKKIAVNDPKYAYIIETCHTTECESDIAFLLEIADAATNEGKEVKLTPKQLIVIERVKIK